MESKNCIVCGQEFLKKVTCSKSNWANSKFCGRSCSISHLHSLGQPMKGKHYSEETKSKMPQLFKKGHQKHGLKNLEKWRAEGGQVWNKGKPHLQKENHPLWKGGVTLDKEKFRERTKYYRSQEKHKLTKRLGQSKRRALITSTNDGTVTSKEILKLKLNQDNKCVLCNCELVSYHIDHIIPLSKKGLHSISNIQLLCPPCNIRKHDRYDPIS